MDRSIVYTQEQGRSTDFLFAQRAGMVGLGKLIEAAFGTTSLVSGLAVVPTSPASLSVWVNPGQIFSTAPLDATAYGVLAADTTHTIVKQGLLMDQATLSCPAPATGGYSINYLIQATYQENDTTNVVLPYFNSANPSVPLSGQSNSGAAQATERQGVCVVAVKAGAAATTGTQATPAPDSGYVGLAVVTVANGATTIIAGNIVIYGSAPYITETLTQKISQATGDTRYALTGSSAPIQGAFKNLQSSATGLSATVLASADEITVENGSNAYATLRSVSLTINSAASGANGLDTGTLAASTWYSVWVIYNGTTTAGLISTSVTAPTMPTGYTHKARIGWIFTDGTANKYPLSFIQYGRRIQLKIAAGSNMAAGIAIASGVAGSTTVPTLVSIATRSTSPTTGSIPSTAGKFIGILTNDGSSGSEIIVAPNSSFGAMKSTTNPAPVEWHAATDVYGGDYSKLFEFQLESANIYWASALAGSKLYVFGWEDNI